LARAWRVVRMQTDVVEKIYDEADMHHDKKVTGDTARSAAACGVTRPSVMTRRRKSTVMIGRSASATRKLWRAEKFQ